MNERFAKLIIDHLIEQGVQRFCLSPGSRITPLAYALSQDERAEKLVHFDERGAAFHALGYAKASKTPCVVFTTSGSAVGNLFPAIMEASVEGIPLIVITADRPPELRDCGANQTCDQVKIFGNYVRWQADIPCPDAAIDDSYIGSTIAQAVYRAAGPHKGPVHLNCMLREPFFSGEPTIERTSIHYEMAHSVLSSHALEAWGKRLSSIEKGVIIVGAHASQRSLKALFALSEQLHWPILPDIFSGVRSEASHSNVIAYYDTIVKIAADLSADAILHLGDRIVSKSLAEWLKAQSPRLYAIVADHPTRYDPSHIATHRMQTDPFLFCEQVLPHVQRKTNAFLESWKTYSQAVDTQIDAVAGNMTEPGLARFLHHHLPPHFALFLANSMPVRDADQFFFPRFYRGPIFGRRGISGIDGNIATACGIAEGIKRPLLAIIGDQTALHDLNSLSQLKKSQTPVIILIINNRGSGIFHFLPIAEKKEVFEEYFAAAHDFSFEHAAQMFHLPYRTLSDFSELRHALKEEKSCVLELQTCRLENADLHKFITEELKTCVKSASCTVF